MARNRIRIDAPPDEVFACLADAGSYPKWVVGAKNVRTADGDWPGPDSGFRPEVGVGPVAAGAATRAVDAVPERRLVLEAEWPFGAATIVIEVEPDGDASVITLDEAVVRPAAVRRLAEPVLHARNAESLRRLKQLVEGGALGAANVAAGLGALRLVDAWLDRDGYRQVLEPARKCYVAVRSRSGPHITPVAFTTLGGRIWFVVDRGTLKANAIERRAEAGILVRDHGSAVIASGRAELLDPWRPWEWPGRYVEAALTVPALLGYGRRNGMRLARYAASNPFNVSKLRPPQRVVVAVTPGRIALVRAGRVVDALGDWPDPPSAFDAKEADPGAAEVRTRLGELPDEIAHVVEQPGADVAVGLQTPAGAVALPGTWDPERGAATIPLEAFGLTGADRRPLACVCFDVEEGPDLKAKKGVLVRGKGGVTTRGAAAEVVLTDAKISYWAGDRRGSLPERGAAP